jgi:hypothetical protein
MCTEDLLAEQRYLCIRIQGLSNIIAVHFVQKGKMASRLEKDVEGEVK